MSKSKKLSETSRLHFDNMISYNFSGLDGVRELIEEYAEEAGEGEKYDWDKLSEMSEDELLVLWNKYGIEKILKEWWDRNN